MESPKNYVQKKNWRPVRRPGTSRVCTHTARERRAVSGTHLVNRAAWPTPAAGLSCLERPSRRKRTPLTGRACADCSSGLAPWRSGLRWSGSCACCMGGKRPQHQGLSTVWPCCLIKLCPASQPTLLGVLASGGGARRPCRPGTRWRSCSAWCSA